MAFQLRDWALRKVNVLIQFWFDCHGDMREKICDYIDQF